MPFICYTPKSFHKKTEAIISKANEILDEYALLGLDLTLRQLYYQFVARDIIPNTFKEYKKLQNTINDARLAGLIDWDRIEDRTRNLETFSSYRSGESAIRNLSIYYTENKWLDQPKHVEVWVEKDALLGVIEKASSKYATPHFSCRGYTSQSEIWNSAQRLARLEKPVTILHLGDHDPSGVDMSRDIQDRMNLFQAYNVEVKRIALTMEQIKLKNPPPNPVKFTDSRATGYEKKFGVKSWELDALDPTFLIDLIHKETAALVDSKLWKAAEKKEEIARNNLEKISENFDVTSRFVNDEEAILNFEYYEDDKQ
jgi:hypothetical protein